MRLLKSLAIITLSSFIGLSAQAEPNKNNQQAKPQKTAKAQPAKAQQSNKAQQQNTKQKQPAKAQAPTPEQQLKRFTDSVALRFGGIVVDTQNNQKMINFKYTLQNTSKKSISKVEWLAVYYYQNTPILSQDVPVELKRLAPKKQQNLVFSFPFEGLSPAAQQVFSNPQNEIAIQFRAKSITFTDKSKIVVP